MVETDGGEVGKRELSIITPHAIENSFPSQGAASVADESLPDFKADPERKKTPLPFVWDVR